MTRNHLTGANIISSHSVAGRRNVLTAFWSPWGHVFPRAPTSFCSTLLSHQTGRKPVCRHRERLATRVALLQHWQLGFCTAPVCWTWCRGSPHAGRPAWTWHCPRLAEEVWLCSMKIGTPLLLTFSNISFTDNKGDSQALHSTIFCLFSQIIPYSDCDKVWHANPRKVVSTFKPNVFQETRT